MRLLGTSEIINRFTKSMTKQAREKMRKEQERLGIQLVKKTRKNGKVRVSGAPALKWSSHYPARFCSQVVEYLRTPPEETWVNQKDSANTSQSKANNIGA